MLTMDSNTIQHVTRASNDNQLKTLPVASDAEFHKIIKYCVSNDVIALELLLESYDCSNILNNLNMRYEEDLQLPISIASHLGFREIVRLLLDKGAGVNMKDKSGMTALIWASLRGHIAVVQLLLDRGADINIQDNYGWTALHSACDFISENIVRMLLEQGAQVNVKGNKGYTPLMYASGNCCHDEYQTATFIKMLLDIGADINAQNENGWTALMYASRKRYFVIVILLIEYDADVTLTNNEGKTAYDIAKQTDIKQYLLQAAEASRSYILK